MLDQRRRRWADAVQMLYKRFVFNGIEAAISPGAYFYMYSAFDNLLTSAGVIETQLQVVENSKWII